MTEQSLECKIADDNTVFIYAEMMFGTAFQNDVVPLRTQTQKKDYSIRIVFFDGRSDWIRTSGHLNPIQVLYQTEPHPEITCTSIPQNKFFVNPFFKKK